MATHPEFDETDATEEHRLPPAGQLPPKKPARVADSTSPSLPPFRSSKPAAGARDAGSEEVDTTAPLPDVRSSLPGEGAVDSDATDPRLEVTTGGDTRIQAPPASRPEKPSPKESGRRAGARPSSTAVPVAADPAPRKPAPKPTRDAVPAAVDRVEPNIKDVSRREVADVDTDIKALGERGSKRASSAPSSTILKPLSAEMQEELAAAAADAARAAKPGKGGRPDDPDADTGLTKAPVAEERGPRRSGAVQGSTLIKPLSEDMQEELAAAAAEAASADKGRKGGAANSSTVIKPAPEPSRGEFPTLDEGPRKGSVANSSTVLKELSDDEKERLSAPPSKKPNVAHASTVLKELTDDEKERLSAPPSKKSNPAHASTVLKELSDDEKERLAAPSPRRSGSAGGASTVLKPIPDEVQEDLSEEDEEGSKPKPLPFVDRSGAAPETTAPAPPRSSKGRAGKAFSTLSHLRTMEGNQKGLLVVAGIFGVLVVVAIVYSLARGGDRPRIDELRRAYPYGYDGARGPHGEAAPGASNVTFTFKMVAPCPQTAEPECLLYEYAGGANFQGRMLLRKGERGWVRASDEGMPFLLAR